MFNYSDNHGRDNLSRSFSLCNFLSSTAAVFLQKILLEFITSPSCVWITLTIMAEITCHEVSHYAVFSVLLLLFSYGKFYTAVCWTVKVVFCFQIQLVGRFPVFFFCIIIFGETNYMVSYLAAKHPYQSVQWREYMYAVLWLRFFLPWLRFFHPFYSVVRQMPG